MNEEFRYMETMMKYLLISFYDVIHSFTGQKFTESSKFLLIF